MKPIIQTVEYVDGSVHSQVWCPFWGSKPTKENADKVIETDNYIELIYERNN